MMDDDAASRFMSLPMWLAWIQRDDVRAGRTATQPGALEDFAAWWVLFGAQEYPAMWSVSAAAAAAAMRPRAPEQLPWLVWRLHQARGDLGARYDIADPEDRADLLVWYRLYAPGELAHAPPLPPEALALTVAPDRRAGWWGDAELPRIAIALHARDPDLCADMPAERAGSAAALARCFALSGDALIPQPHAPHPAPLPLPAAKRGAGGPDAGELGVNLIGFATGELGVGETVRALSRGLDLAGIAHGVIDLPPGPGSSRRDLSIADRLIDAPIHPVSLLCVPPFDAAQLMLDGRADLFAARHLIGVWYWELPRFPAHASALLHMFDEIWAPTRAAADGFAATGGAEVRLMPPAVEIGDLRPPMPGTPRPDGPFRFYCPFDRGSFVARKNPAAAIAAFRAAFPPSDDGVALVVRINGERGAEADIADLVIAAEADPRIRFVTGTLDRPAALAMLAGMDCLVSPHRAEGFGLNIAEAIRLDVPVLATGFGGCTDFLLPEETVPAHPRPIAEGEYPHAGGMIWADIDRDALARRMAEIRAIPPGPARARALASRRALFERTYAPRPAAERVARRLAEIFASLAAR